MLTEVRRRLMVLAIVLGVLAAACGTFLLTPYGRSRERLQEDYEKLRVERQRKERENGSLANIDQKLVAARQQIAAFYRDRLPEQYSSVSAELTKLASQSGVKLGTVKYDVDKDSPAPDVRLLHLSASVTGDYKNVAKFVNVLERDTMLFDPASVELTENQQGVTLELKLNTYLRERTGAAGGI
jgi:Tfp pilus assembly protein PilO